MSDAGTSDYDLPDAPPEKPTAWLPIMRFFAYEHLPARLQEVSKPFSSTAMWMVANLPNNDERSAGLRKLLEAKDCAVRSALWAGPV